MIGEARLLDVEVPLPAGVRLRRVTDEADVRAMVAMQGQAFGDPGSSEMADELLERLARGDGMELWVAEAEGQIVSAGRLEPVAGTDFAGIWGGATLEGWRGRGIYRALTAARARLGPGHGQDPDQQRLDRVLPTDSRAIGADQGLDDDSLPLAAVTDRRA